MTEPSAATIAAATSSKATENCPAVALSSVSCLPPTKSVRAAQSDTSVYLSTASSGAAPFIFIGLSTVFQDAAVLPQLSNRHLVLLSFFGTADIRLWFVLDSAATSVFFLPAS